MSADPDVFFPISSSGPALQQVEQARKICAGCQVQQPCLDFALATGQVHGVWGGTTEEERVRLLRQRPAHVPSAHQPAPHAHSRQRQRRTSH